jgi:hypothetical protein
MGLEPIEDFRTVKHTTGLARVGSLDVRLFVRVVNDAARATGFRDGVKPFISIILGKHFPAPTIERRGQRHRGGCP